MGQEEQKHTIIYVREFDVLMETAKKDFAKPGQLVALTLEYKGKKHHFSENELLEKLGIKH